MLLLAALLCTPLLATGGHVECNCSATLCGCLVDGASRGDNICSHSPEATHCSEVRLAGEGGDVVRLNKSSGFQPDCLCHMEFCACIGMQPTKYDQICLHSSKNTVCNPLQPTGSNLSRQISDTE
ncbi:uncharacterized protein LOC124613328 [Schistocerca americana]|uniref:uncharacterized protein LOC124613328 n=1 Tax=Schistocerca americana TaxID=7009 RepID=UPI001F503BBC|nr:uncharacterized protein LOC124613328 [Schistocerca americana]